MSKFERQNLSNFASHALAVLLCLSHFLFHTLSVTNNPSSLYVTIVCYRCMSHLPAKTTSNHRRSCLTVTTICQTSCLFVATVRHSCFSPFTNTVCHLTLSCLSTYCTTSTHSTPLHTPHDPVLYYPCVPHWTHNKHITQQKSTHVHTAQKWSPSI